MRQESDCTSLDQNRTLVGHHSNTVALIEHFESGVRCVPRCDAHAAGLDSCTRRRGHQNIPSHQLYTILIDTKPRARLKEQFEIVTNNRSFRAIRCVNPIARKNVRCTR